MKIDITINGTAHTLNTEPGRRLLDVLRNDLRLTGSKEGCGEGECGACTVLVDGVAANACLIPIAQMHGHAITTIEGLSQGDALHPVQEALVQLGGTQCGICTPGVALSVHQAITSEPNASRARLRELIAGNLCRCTGYQLIIDAAVEAAARLNAPDA